MKKNQFPKGWDEARIRSVLEYYESQTDAEAVAEIEQMPEKRETVVMRIPLKLLPEIRKLIAKHDTDG